MELSLLTYRAGQIPGGEKLMTNLWQEIRLLLDITFTCPTVITSLALGIEVFREDNNRNQYPSVLVVRPASNGYTLLTEQTISYTPDNISTNGVHNYPLDPPISVNVGDILGVRAPRRRNSAVIIYYALENGLDYQTWIFINNLNELDNKQLGYGITDNLVLAYPITGEAGLYYEFIPIYLNISKMRKIIICFTFLQITTCALAVVVLLMLILYIREL